MAFDKGKHRNRRAPGKWKAGEELRKIQIRRVKIPDFFRSVLMKNSNLWLCRAISIALGFGWRRQKMVYSVLRSRFIIIIPVEPENLRIFHVLWMLCYQSGYNDDHLGWRESEIQNMLLISIYGRIHGRVMNVKRKALRNFFGTIYLFVAINYSCSHFVAGLSLEISWSIYPNTDDALHMQRTNAACELHCVGLRRAKITHVPL